MKLTSEQYVKEMGLACPHCGSADIATDGPVECDAGVAWQTVTCHECNHHWTDEYQLKGYSNLKENLA